MSEQNAHAFETREQAREFIGAGKALVTVVSRKTGTRFTYRVTQSSDGERLYVAVLSGTQNEKDYTYLGTVFPDGYRHGKKSPCAAGVPSEKAWEYLWTIVQKAGPLPELIEVLHNGQCGRCGRTLTTPESIKTGIGPVCSGR